MSDYRELVERLRASAHYDEQYGEPFNWLLTAADEIESLTAELVKVGSHLAEVNQENAKLRNRVSVQQAVIHGGGTPRLQRKFARVKAALAARDAACGHLPNELVAAWLGVIRDLVARGPGERTITSELDPDNPAVVQLLAATFEAGE